MVKLFLTQDQGKIIGPFVILMGFVIDALYKFLALFGIESAAWTIVLMTFIINGLMIPLTIKQQKSSKLQSRMAPELNAIQKKYKGKTDQQSMLAQQAETKAVYDKYGTSALSGCLPMLITLPIMLALYRVIYNVPAYVGAVKEYYENVAVLIQGTNGYVDILQTYLGQVAISTKGWGDVAHALSTADSNSVNYIIDILAKLTPDQWNSLANDFPTIQTQIMTFYQEISHVNSFLGMDITSMPSLTSISVIIPVLAVVTQFISTKLMTVNNPIDPDNPAAATMKSMNITMPIVSGIMGLFLPIGVGLYWVAGSVFRIIQQFFINKYFEKMDIDQLIEKNRAKAEKKRQKRGITTEQSLQQVATQKTSTVKDRSEAVKASNKKITSSKEVKDYKKGEVSYDPNSISSIANMLGGKKE